MGMDGVWKVYQEPGLEVASTVTSHFPCVAQATWSLCTAGGSGKCFLAGADKKKGMWIW